MKSDNSRYGQDNAGFTLIEVLIAMVIIAIGIIALTSMQSMGIKGNASANVMTTGGTWAADLVEQVFAMEYDDVADGSRVSSDGNYTVSWTVTEDKPLDDTKKINITVVGNDMGSNRTVNIEYVRAKYVN